MKTKNISIILLISASLLWGCSKLQQNLPEPTTPTVTHSEGWMSPTTTDFHGKYLRAKNWKLDDCIQCHANNYEGGVSKVSCYQCHTTYPHKQGFLIKNNPNYHGFVLKNSNWNLTSCKTCHGQNFEGGNSGIKCSTCHESYPHQAGWKEISNDKFHGRFLKSKNWDLPLCVGCHGTNYDGGTVTNMSCMTSNCHVDKFLNKKSPEACNTCHGDFTARAELVPSWAPPKSVDGDTVKTVRGVGAHQKHLATNTIGFAVKCKECHSVPAQTFTTGHIDTQLPAEVVMNDTLARLVTGSGTLIPNPAYDYNLLSCSNSYCHGNWKLRKAASSNAWAYTDTVMTGIKKSPKWTGGSNEAACGTCHGLPPSGHISVTINDCANCHPLVVNNSGVIINQSKHINGKINYGLFETPMK